MPRGDKSSYSAKQKRQARHIEESSKKRGYSTKVPKKLPGPRSTSRMAGPKVRMPGVRDRKAGDAPMEPCESRSVRRPMLVLCCDAIRTVFGKSSPVQPVTSQMDCARRYS